MNTAFLLASKLRVLLASCCGKKRRAFAGLFVATGAWVALGAPGAALAASPEQDAEAALMPFFDVLANPPAGKARAFRIRGRVESIGPISFVPGGADSSNLNANALQGLPEFDFALQPPDRMRISAPLGELTVTGCRNQQKLWAAPGGQVQPLLEALKATPRPKKNERNVLQPIQIPFSGKHLAMLPILLEVQSRGQAALDQAPTRVLDVRVQPDVGRLLPQEIGTWALRLWLNGQGRPTRLGVQTPNGNAVIRIESIDFSPGFPEQLWTAPEGAVSLTPAEFEDLSRSLSRATKGRK